MLGRVVCGSRTWMWTMAAPALAASIADAAMSRGVTGTAGLRAGVSADPVTAQAIITLRCIIRLPSAPPNGSLDAQMRVVHHLAPLGDLALDAGAEFLRLVRHRHETELEQVCRDVRLGHRLGDLTVQQVDDLLRRARRRQHAGESVSLLTGVAGFLHGRNVGKFRDALARDPGTS